MRILTQIGLVALGSALGGLLRWGVTLAVARLLGTRFPWGTLLINLSGCLFLGWFVTLMTHRVVLPPTGWLRADDLRLLIAVGFTGAYTTFSTFGVESDALVRDGHCWLATLYVVASVALGLLAVRVGAGLARW